MGELLSRQRVNAVGVLAERFAAARAAACRVKRPGLRWQLGPRPGVVSPFMRSWAL